MGSKDGTKDTKGKNESVTGNPKSKFQNRKLNLYYQP